MPLVKDCTALVGRELKAMHGERLHNTGGKRAEGDAR